MTEGSAGQERTPTPRLKYFVIAVVVIVVLQILYGVIVSNSFAPMDERGQFGDLFGGLNALFTGLAFAGLIYTILLQRRELELQRDELRLTRGELRASAEAQTNQVTQLKVSADLSAVTALVNVYGTLLRPHWETMRGLRSELAHVESARRGPTILGLEESMELDDRMRSLRKEIDREQAVWAATLRKHQGLVARLEGLVGQTDKPNPAPTD